MGKYQDVIIGEIYPNTRLTPLEMIGRDRYRRKIWKCQCTCGNITTIRDDCLKRGGVKSCGCYIKKISSDFCKKRFKKYNLYDLTHEYGIGYDSKGREFYFDIEDYDSIKDFCWCVRNDSYVMTSNNGYLHDLIALNMGLSKNNKEIDHKNGKRFDCRRDNLRLATRYQQQMNRGMPKNNTSGHKGISKHRNSWRAQIGCNGKYYTKCFNCSKYPNAYELACQWYDEKAQELFGEYRREE